MSVDGKVAFTGTLQPNDTKEISANERVKILTGNAGGLTISLNGKTLDPLGPSGQVRVGYADGGRSAVPRESSPARARSALALRRLRSASRRSASRIRLLARSAISNS